MSVKRFIIEAEPMGAPRMTQRDRWAKRPVVQRYWAWKDKAREAAGELPPAESIQSVSWVAVFVPPVSWSKKKRAAAMGTLHRSKPDIDNIFKAVLDSLFDEDKHIAAGGVKKVWGEIERMEVEIVYSEEPR